jgi:hypothetical protein
VALFRRRHHQEPAAVDPIAVRPKWARRLGVIGDALDATGQDIRDLAIVLKGGPEDGGAQISLLGHRQSIFHSGWASLMFRLETGADELIDQATGLSATAYRASITTQLIGEWGRSLRAIGALIDERPQELRSPTLVFVSGGVVINGILRDDLSFSSGALGSFELSSEQIRTAITLGTAPYPPAMLTARQR